MPSSGSATSPADAEPADHHGLHSRAHLQFQDIRPGVRDDPGGPAGASQTVIMLLYDTAFKFFRFGDASVMAVFVFVTLMVVTLLQWRLFRKPVEY